jgi:hypothetical protein
LHIAGVERPTVSGQEKTTRSLMHSGFCYRRVKERQVTLHASWQLNRCGKEKSYLGSMIHEWFKQLRTTVARDLQT